MREGWIETTLGNSSDIQMGQSPDGSTYNLEGNGLPFMQGSAEFGEHFPKPEKWCSEPKKIAEFGDLLLSVRAPVGDTNFADQRIAVGRGLSVIRGKAGHSITEFLRLNIQLNVVEMISSSGAGMFSSITGQNLRDFSVLLPPLQEQKRIVDLISSVDSYIDALQQQADSARKSRNAVLHEMLSAVEDGWVTHKLGDLLQINRGGSPRPIQQFLTNSSNGVNWIKIADATASTKYIFETKQKILASGVERSRAVKSGDFILSNSMSYGRPYIMRTAGAIHDGWLLLSHVDEYFDEDFLYNLLLSDSVQKQFDALSAGSGVQNLNIEVVKKVVVRIPDIEEQRTISKVLNEYDSLELAMDNTIDNSRRFRSGLLSDLLSGEHEIPTSYDKIIGTA